MQDGCLASQQMVQEAFKFAFEHLKPIDAVIVGMYPRSFDQVRALCAVHGESSALCSEDQLAFKEEERQLVWEVKEFPRLALKARRNVLDPLLCQPCCDTNAYPKEATMPCGVRGATVADANSHLGDRLR